MDESTDIMGLAILLVFVRYIYNSTIKKDLLLCKFLETHTRSKDIFLLVDSYFEEHEMSCKNCSSVCIDGAASMVSKYSGVVAHIRNMNSKLFTFTACYIDMLLQLNECLLI